MNRKAQAHEGRSNILTDKTVPPPERNPVPGWLRSAYVRALAEASTAQLAGLDESARDAHPAVKECFHGRTVIVTGAGGSIGSEIVRQVSALGVEQVVAVDQDESALFELMIDLPARDSAAVQPMIANIRDHETVRRVFARYRPQIVLHAAAYKHVPVMETNCAEAVLNNVSATRQLADISIEFGCERMVMISTDKAVYPSSVMGATKRAAELLIQERARYRSTRFACVRFGNVLGSRGSVLTIFLRQIAEGGPVTVTHEDMTRYFITTPQAVRLVLQAATLASDGDVYVLDMGDPVRIMDVAHDMIRLAGLTPGKDIEVKIIGARPGEKLHEMPWQEDGELTSTPFPDVFRVKASSVPPDFPQRLAELEVAARTGQSNNEIQELLARLPIEYCPRRPQSVSSAG